MAQTRKRRDSKETRARLIAAAEGEFNARGFHGTDTNRIARRAGYAPQTFYRHFSDKTAIFLAVYDRWWRAEAEAVGQALASPKGRGGGLTIARIVLEFHGRWRGFRRSLRHLAVEDPKVRKARAVARKAQILRWKKAGVAGSKAALAAGLLAAERLCDAAAEGEFADLGLSTPQILRLVACAMADLLEAPAPDLGRGRTSARRKRV